MADEEVLLELEGEGVKITTARVVFGDTTIAASTIASVSTEQVPLPSGSLPVGCGYALAIVLALVALPTFMGREEAMWLGVFLLLAAGAVVYWTRAETAKRVPKYRATFTTVAGAAFHYTSLDEEDVRTVAAAVEKMIVSRNR